MFLHYAVVTGAVYALHVRLCAAMFRGRSANARHITLWKSVNIAERAVGGLLQQNMSCYPKFSLISISYRVSEANEDSCPWFRPGQIAVLL